MIDLSFTILGQTIPAGHGYSTHLAQLCRVTVGRLNAAVERNRLRFPPDFVFPLTAADWGDLKSQIAISRSGWGGRRSLPHALTECGVTTLSSMLNSERAVRVNITIVRAFLRLRGVMPPIADLNPRAMATRVAPAATDESILAPLAALPCGGSDSSLGEGIAYEPHRCI